MNTQTVTIQLPKNIYEHLQNAALAQKRPMQKLLQEAVSAGLPLVNDLPLELANEMTAMALLNDQALLRKTQSELPAVRQKKMDRLLDKKQAGKLDGNGQAELNMLLSEVERIVLVRAQAAALLTQRGYRIVPSSRSIPAKK